MPGMENLAPERTETSKGFVGFDTTAARAAIAGLVIVTCGVAACGGPKRGSHSTRAVKKASASQDFEKAAQMRDLLLDVRRTAKKTAKFERIPYTLPVAVMMAVPFAVFGALAAIGLRGLPNDIYFQIGLLTLIGLAAMSAGGTLARRRRTQRDRTVGSRTSSSEAHRTSTVSGGGSSSSFSSATMLS